MHTCVACVRTVYRYSCNDEADKNDSNTNYLHCTAVVEHIRGGTVWRGVVWATQEKETTTKHITQ